MGAFSSDAGDASDGACLLAGDHGCVLAFGAGLAFTVVLGAGFLTFAHCDGVKCSALVAHRGKSHDARMLGTTFLSTPVMTTFFLTLLSRSGKHTLCFGL
jgi:hypothetical protein